MGVMFRFKGWRKDRQRLKGELPYGRQPDNPANAKTVLKGELTARVWRKSTGEWQPFDIDNVKIAEVV